MVNVFEDPAQCIDTIVVLYESVHVVVCTLSVLPEAIKVLLWLMEMSDTTPEWPLKVARSLPSLADQTLPDNYLFPNYTQEQTCDKM